MADVGEAIAAGDSVQEHWNSSLSDHTPGINDQDKESLLSEQFQNILLTLVKGGKLDDEGGEGLVPEDVLTRDPWDGHRDREGQVEGLGESLESLDDGLAYPRRPRVVDCGYYLRTGTCRFGASCKFNHPPTRTIPDGQEKDVLDGSREFNEKQGQVECKFYKTSGGCKYGNACRYKHTNLKASDPSDVELNFLGLPLRPGTKECQYYMRSGTCKYAADCWFNHPDPTVEKESDFSAGLCNITPTATQSCLQQNGWEDSGPFFPTGLPTKLKVPVEYSTYNSYQAPHYMSERSIHQSLSYSTSDTLRDIGSWTVATSEYPERPGQPDCSYFLKTGNCKYKSNCRYNHPKDRLSIFTQTTHNHKGLPLRPGQIPCSHYIRHGICKFGQSCKFDHPNQLSSSFLVGNNGPAVAGMTNSLW